MFISRQKGNFAILVLCSKFASRPGLWQEKVTCQSGKVSSIPRNITTSTHFYDISCLKTCQNDKTSLKNANRFDKS